MKKIIILSALLLAGISSQAQVSQWIAYNDHFLGPLSGANATPYNIFASGAPGSGLLKNSVGGSPLAVTLSVTSVVTGVTGGTTSSGPNAGTPASLLFTNQVDFGNANSNHAIQLASSAKIVHAFSGLDPARRYSWHGTTARGGGYSDRWTLLEISAASWQDAHSTTATGLFTLVSSPNISTLTSSQAVANFGENRLLGTYACWTNIQPNPDGTILIYQSSYHGTMPGTFTSGGTYGYGVVADRLEEFTIGPSSCVAITNQSGNISVPERGSALFSITATGTPQTIQWYRSNDVTGFQAISGANGSSYSIPSVAYPGDNNTHYRATVSNTICNVTSTVKVLTVLPDTTPPTIVRVVGNPGLDTVTVTFSEAVEPGVASDPGNYAVYPTGGDPDGDNLIVSGVVLSTSSNAILTTASLRIAGTNYSLRLLEIRDASSQQNVIDPNPTDIQFITQEASLIDFVDNNVWKFGTLSNSVAGPTFNPATEFSIPVGWETVGYDDSAWPEGPAGLGLDASVNGVPIVTPTGYSARSEPTFFRRHFTLPALTNGLVINMRHVFEDGAVVYINGVDSYRFNVGAATDVNNPVSRSAAAAADPTPITTTSLSLSNVHAGDNVIAVVVLQSGATSSDIEMAIELTAEIPQYPAGPIVINSQPVASTTVNEGQPFTLGVGVSGAIPITYQWRKAGVAIPGETNPTYHVTAALPSHQATYTVAVSNSFGGLISSSASVTVLADTIAPVIISAVGSTNMEVVTVTLYDATGINLTQAQTPGNYNIHLTAGGGTLTCTSAVAVVSGTNLVVTLMTDSPRAAGQNYTVTISNVRDTSAAQNLVTPGSHTITATVIVFGFAQVWRYEETGADLGTAWRASGYNDSAWPSGAGFLGFEDTVAVLTTFTNLAGGSGTNTVLSLTNNVGGGYFGTNVTIYFRTTASLPFDPNAVGNTVLARSYIDDGAAIYVNGAESMRFNLTNTANYTNFATAGSTENVLTVSNLTGFVQGNNVIAVEVHQNSFTSSDIDWGMQLEALVTTFAAVGPTLHITRNEITGAVTVSWSGGGTLRSTTSLLSAGTVWTAVPGNPNPYVFTPVVGQPVKFFSLAP